MKANKSVPRVDFRIIVFEDLVAIDEMFAWLMIIVTTRLIALGSKPIDLSTVALSVA